MVGGLIGTGEWDNCEEIVQVRDVRCEETIVAGEYRYRVVGASELERLFTQGRITEAMRDAGLRLYSDWYDSGLAGRGKTAWERTCSSGFTGSRYENMNSQEEQAYRDYLKARKSISNPYQHEVSNVCLYDMCCINIAVLCSGLTQLAKYYKLGENN